MPHDNPAPTTPQTLQDDFSDLYNASGDWNPNRGVIIYGTHSFWPLFDSLVAKFSADLGDNPSRADIRTKVVFKAMAVAEEATRARSAWHKAHEEFVASHDH